MRNIGYISGALGLRGQAVKRRRSKVGKLCGHHQVSMKKPFIDVDGGENRPLNCATVH